MKRLLWNERSCESSKRNNTIQRARLSARPIDYLARVQITTISRLSVPHSVTPNFCIRLMNMTDTERNSKYVPANLVSSAFTTQIAIFGEKRSVCISGLPRTGKRAILLQLQADKEAGYSQSKTMLK